MLWLIAYDDSFIANTDVSVGLYLNSFQHIKDDVYETRRQISLLISHYSEA